MRSFSQRRFSTLIAALVLSPLGCSLALAAETGGQPAVWTQKEFQFTYQGFTTKYTCDGLHDKVRDILLQFGARKDMQITRWGCAGSSGHPDPFPGVAVKMSVLALASDASEAQTEPPVAAHWKSVKLRLDRSAVSAAGECELVEQVKQKILPLFNTRNVEYRSICVPHQLTPGGTELAADVLIADPVPTAAAAAAAG